MTATELPGRGPARPGRLARSLRGAGLSGASVAGASAAGALVSVRAAYPRPPRAAPPEGWPPPRPVPRGRLAVAVVLGASGSVITDALGPYEVFARSPEFFVYTVSARPAAMLSGALAVVPDYSLSDVDAGTAPEPAVVVIPAVVSRPAGRTAAARMARPPGRRGAQLLGVCAGSRLLAAAGLLDGRRATSHWSRIRGLERSRPQVDWVRGQRYIQDGTITTTAGVTSGVFGALRLVQQLAGAAEAQRVGRELGYPGWSLDGPTGIPAQRLAPRDLTNLLAALAPWRAGARRRARRRRGRDRRRSPIRGLRQLVRRPHGADRRRAHRHDPPRAAPGHSTRRRRRTPRRPADRARRPPRRPGRPAARRVGGRAWPRHRTPTGGRRVQLRRDAARPRRPRRPDHRQHHRQIHRIPHQPPPASRPGMAAAARHPVRPYPRSRHRRRVPPGGRHHRNRP